MSTEFFEVNGIKVANIKNESDITFFGISVLAGSNYEVPKNAGISHFAEHLFFKGTETRNWQQINEEFAKLGVYNNAYTSDNDVLYYSSCPQENLKSVIDLMLDMFFHSTIPEEELEKERGVITEEKKMYEDDPKSAFASAIGNDFFSWDKGHDIIGTFETIKSISRSDVINFLEDKINLSNVIFICCGNVDSEDLKKYISKNIPSEHPYLKEGTKNIVSDEFWSDAIERPGKIKLTVERENITQANISMLTQGLPSDDDLHYESIIVYETLGGGMYSKLFARIREELGLCYSVGMYNATIAYPRYTMTDLYGYTAPENVDLFIEESEKVIQDTIENGLDDNIFECAKTQLIASLLRRTETSTGRAMFFTQKYLDGKEMNLNEIIEKTRGIKKETCNEVISSILEVPFNWAIMIPKG